VNGPAFTELRENLREAAERDVAARRARGRSLRRRTGGLLAVLVFGAAAAAGAANLISQGQPVKDTRPRSEVNRPGDSRKLSVVARRNGRAWGVAVYKSRDGQTCVIAGELNGVRLGETKNGTFHQYPADLPGACAQTSSRARNIDVVQRGDVTLFAGWLGPDIKSMPYTVNGDRHVVKPAADGAFLDVYEGDYPPASFHTGKPVYAAGTGSGG
jgi:hypothetical protein